jgi:hypothetical protein
MNGWPSQDKYKNDFMSLWCLSSFLNQRNCIIFQTFKRASFSFSLGCLNDMPFLSNLGPKNDVNRIQKWIKNDIIFATWGILIMQADGNNMCVF